MVKIRSTRKLPVSWRWTPGVDPGFLRHRGANTQGSCVPQDPSCVVIAHPYVPHTPPDSCLCITMCLLFFLNVFPCPHPMSPTPSYVLDVLCLSYSLPMSVCLLMVLPCIPSRDVPCTPPYVNMSPTYVGRNLDHNMDQCMWTYNVHGVMKLAVGCQINTFVICAQMVTAHSLKN